jgi:predicted HicB family RNase H-like nuclease
MVGRVPTRGKTGRAEQRVSTAVRLPQDLHEELQRAAEERDVSVNFLVTRAVYHYLNQLGPADPLEPAPAGS